MLRDKPLYLASREEWRKWLSRNHGSQDEVWLIHHKKHSQTPALSLSEAVEEAICFGWIDSRIRRIDEERYAVRYTPRRGIGSWSKYNKARALKMLREGGMTRAGIQMLPNDVLKSWKKGKPASKRIDPRTSIA